MSKQLDLSQPLSDEQVADLRSRHGNEYVDYLVGVANGSAFADGEETPDPDAGEFQDPALTGDQGGTPIDLGDNAPADETDPEQPDPEVGPDGLTDAERNGDQPAPPE